MCSYHLLLVNSIFCCELHFLSSYEYQSEVNFLAVGSTPAPYLGCNLINLNLGSIPSPAPVPSMSHLSSCDGLTLDMDPDSDPYLGCNFLTLI